MMNIRKVLFDCDGYIVTDMKNAFLLMYYGFIPALFFFDFFQERDIMKKIGGLESFFNIILVFYTIQYKNKKAKFDLVDLYLIEALLFTATGGLLLLFFKDYQLLMFINTVGFYLTQFMYINIFRTEGSFLPAFSSVIKDWKIIILTILFFLGLAYFLITYTPNSLLVLSFVYSTQMMVLCWMAYFRPIPSKAFFMGFAGVFLLVMSNLWLAFNLLYRHFSYGIGIYFVLYATSQFLLVESILYNQNLSKN